MSFECWAVLHRETRKDAAGRKRQVGPDRPDGYHSSERMAGDARDRWAKRRPECKFRVARLVEP